MKTIENTVIQIDKYEICIKVNSETSIILSNALWALDFGLIQKIVFLYEKQKIFLKKADKNLFSDFCFEINKNAIGYLISQLNYYIFFGYAQTDHLHIECRSNLTNEYNSVDLTLLFSEFRVPMTPVEAKRVM